MDAQVKILIADDESVIIDFFDVMLTKLGFKVERSENGLDVLDKVKNFQPDIILLDNIMPGMIGREIAKTLKSDPAYRNISIIMISALDDVKEKVASFEAGVDHYITKPFNFTEVLARINASLRNRVLFNQIQVRETRLALAEELNRDLKENLSLFTGSINELDKTISGICKNLDGNLCKEIKPISDKIASVSKHISALESRIEKTINELDNMKKDEIGFPALENQIRKMLHQEQQ